MCAYMCMCGGGYCTCLCMFCALCESLPFLPSKDTSILTVCTTSPTCRSYPSIAEHLGVHSALFSKGQSHERDDGSADFSGDAGGSQWPVWMQRLFSVFSRKGGGSGKNSTGGTKREGPPPPPPAAQQQQQQQQLANVSAAHYLSNRFHTSRDFPLRMSFPGLEGDHAW